MSLSSKIDQIHLHMRCNRWLSYFSIFLRLILAFGFITSGIVKLVGERFAAGLSANHPMGQYLEALHHTGYYYTFIGIFQVVAAILLLIPRTVALGALLYFPIILNIFVLSYALRFEGSSLTSPLMVLACLFLIGWNYDKIKYILPFDHGANENPTPIPKPFDRRFPIKFFLSAAALIAGVILYVVFGFGIAPRNSPKDCASQFSGTNRTKAGEAFCDCIHKDGLPLDTCLAKYYMAPDDLPSKNQRKKTR